MSLQPHLRAPQAFPSVRRRALLATVLLLAQLLVVMVFARVRFDLPWNREPGHPPAVVASDESPAHWNRLVVARWDAQHYVNLALRGYAQCPASLRQTGRLPPPTMTCDLAFFPGYPLAGWLVSLGGILPVDHALLALSLLSSWIFFFLWTSREVMEALGRRVTLVALLAFNLFTTGFTVVTLQTEPPLLAASLGTLVLARRGRWLLAAIAAGVATGMRVSGAAVGLAFAAMVLVDGLHARGPAVAWVRRGLLALLGSWGLLVMLAYHAVVFHDPLVYVHAHERSFGHQPSLAALLRPEVSWLLRSFTSPLHEGVWVAAALLWLGLGLRDAMAGFDAPARAYGYTLTAGVLVVSLLGSVSRSFIGMNRYLLAAWPMFFAMGKVLAPRPVALGIWLGLCAWHGWNVDLCFYVGDMGANTLRRCHAVTCDPR